MDKLAKIILACFPKSGSTYMSRALATYLNVPALDLQTCYEIQTLSVNRIHAYKDKSYVSQIHLLPTFDTVALLNAYKLKVVVLERNILDCIVSARDHFNRDHLKDVPDNPRTRAWKNAFVGQAGMVMDEYYELPPANQLDYLIENMLQWYLKFHMGWRKRLAELETPPVFVNYEDFFAEPNKGLAKLLQALSLFDEKRFAQYQLPQKTQGGKGLRFNQGVKGRGRKTFNTRQLARIEEIISIFELANKIPLVPLIT